MRSGAVPAAAPGPGGHPDPGHAPNSDPIASTNGATLSKRHSVSSRRVRRKVKVPGFIFLQGVLSARDCGGTVVPTWKHVRGLRMGFRERGDRDAVQCGETHRKRRLAQGGAHNAATPSARTHARNPHGRHRLPQPQTSCTQDAKGLPTGPSAPEVQEVLWFGEPHLPSRAPRQSSIPTQCRVA